MQPETIPALLYERCRKTPDTIAHYSLDPHGRWQPHTWQEYYDEVIRLARGLTATGLTAGQAVGIMAPASRQWDIAQMAVLFCNGIVVGLDPHDASENINNIARRAELSGLIVRDVSLLEKIDVSLRGKLLFILSLTEETSSGGKAENIRRIRDVLPGGDPDNGYHPDPVSKTDPATIIFTSGTTGIPKGIQYTHGQVVFACNSILEAFSDIDEKSSLVCWLPLSNLYQRIINYCAIVVGAATSYVEDPRNVLKHMREINPHIFLGVPRFYEKLHAGILDNIAQKNPLVRYFTNWALRTGLQYKKGLRRMEPAGYLTKIAYRLADMMVLKHIRGLMGKNLRYMISGSAPISQWLLEQFDAMGFLILEAYGISENIIPIAANRPDFFKFGTVGKPLPGNEVTLADDGELLVRGPGVFGGYFHDDETQSPLTKDGFLATGDFGRFTPDGFLMLTGRKSEIFKTSTGRRVSPVKVEALISRLPYVEHAVIFGAGRPFLVALLTIDLSKLRQKSTQSEPDTRRDADAIPNDYYETISNDVVREVSILQGYLQPAGLLLSAKPFTIDGGELTANLKVRRKVIAEKFEPEIAALYTEIDRTRHVRTGSLASSDKIVVQSL